MNYRAFALLIVCIAVVIVAGCTSIPGGITKSAVSPEAAPSANAAIRYSQDTNLGNTGGAIAPVPSPVTPPGGLPGQGIDTKIIKTADVTLEVSDVTGAVETIKGIGTRYGGYLSTTSIEKNYNDQLTGTVILRIPADQFDGALNGVKGVGIVKSISTQGQDVTEEYVDVQAQITSYQNQLAQYNEIMKKAVKVQDIIDIQQQIDQVQTNLDRLNGRMKYLNSQIDYSTITVTLQEPEPVGGQGGHDFVAAINEGIAGFFGVIDAIIVLILSLLPLILIGGAAYGGYRLWKRKQPVQAKTATTEQRDLK